MTETLSFGVYSAARDGLALSMYAFLCNRTTSEVREALHFVMEEDGQATDSFIIAARNGHEKVIKILLSHFSHVIDIEQEGVVKFDGFVIEGATALWCAAGAGHFDVVKTLVENNANVNHPTWSNSTPLRAACFEGRLDIVKYLIDNKADMHITNKYDNTCLMIATYKGHGDVVAYLLEKGADPNSRAHCGTTALHFACERGKIDIVKDLIQYGANMLTNEHGMTPLQLAADSGQDDIVEFFVEQPFCSRAERIAALELLGASYSNEKEHYDMRKCYQYLWLGMQERFVIADNVIQKVVMPAREAYNSRLECQTVDEIENIKDDADAVHMEALIVRERILGPNNPDIPHPVIYRGAVYADTARFDRCIALWLHALRLRQTNDRTITKDILRFSQVFSQMIHLGIEVDFLVAEEVLTCTLVEFDKDMARLSQVNNKEEADTVREIINSNFYTMLYLIIILTKVRCTKDEEFRLCRLVYRFIKLDLRMTNKKNYTTLHIACDEDTPVDDFHVNDIVVFPNDILLRLLLQCGADPNAVDLDGNSPLHLIVQYNKPISDFITLHNIIVSLVESGVHQDSANKEGKTAAEMATTGVAEIILRTRQQISLKCIAATAVKKQGLSYEGQLPIQLEEFVTMH